MMSKVCVVAFVVATGLCACVVAAGDGPQLRVEDGVLHFVVAPTAGGSSPDALFWFGSDPDQGATDSISVAQMDGAITQLKTDVALAQQGVDGLTAPGGAVANEIIRAIAAEGELGGRIDDLTSATGAITVEKERAMGAEGALDDRIDGLTAAGGAITAEISRATAAESLLDGKISGEETRATNAESALGGRVDALTADGGAIFVEVRRATNAETALGSRIDALTQAGGAVTLEQLARSAKDDELLDMILDLDKAGGAIFVERQRALAAEEHIMASIAALSDEGGALKNEIDRATARENSIEQTLLNLAGDHNALDQAHETTQGEATALKNRIDLLESTLASDIAGVNAKVTEILNCNNQGKIYDSTGSGQCVDILAQANNEITELKAFKTRVQSFSCPAGHSVTSFAASTGLPVCSPGITGQGCGANEAVASVDGSGKVVCKALVQRSLCDGGKFFKGYNADGSPSCSNHVSFSSCPSGEYLTGITGTGTLTCAPAVGASQTCGAGQSVRGFKADGSPICTDIIDLGTSCGSGQFVTGISSNGALNCAADKQVPFSQSCPTGEFFQGLNANGIRVCAKAVKVSQQCSGKAINGIDANGNVQCSASLSALGSCPDGQVLKGFQTSGARVCVTDVHANFGDACPVGQFSRGLDGSGNKVCGASVKVSQSCGNKAVKGFDANGNKICSAQDLITAGSCGANQLVKAISSSGVTCTADQHVDLVPNSLEVCGDKLLTGRRKISAFGYKISNQQVNSLDEAILIDENVFRAGTHTIGGQTYEVSTYISEYDGVSYDYADFNGGHFGGANSWPSGIGGDDFAFGVVAYVDIPAGTWSIGAGSDDGRYLKLEGVTFSAKRGQSGYGGADTVGFAGLTGHNWSFGTFTVGAGGLKCAKLRSMFYERGGGDSFEIAIAAGNNNQTPNPSAGWTILRDGALGWSVH